MFKRFFDLIMNFLQNYFIKKALENKDGLKDKVEEAVKDKVKEKVKEEFEDVKVKVDEIEQIDEKEKQRFKDYLDRLVNKI